MAIPHNAVVMHHTGEVAEDIAMGIHAEDFPFLADMLNGIYSDVIAAPVREYATNAWDSHVEAGVTRPIEITLPTTDRLEFVVQDFGIGMSIDDLRNTYAFYGASDKRNSNDVAGQLGIGSKSGLSYADAFTVTAVKNHEKVTAVVTKDERGLGVIKILVPPAATDEPNGVRIQIPVDRYDVSDFHTAAEFLFQFWAPGTVLIDGEAPATPEWAQSALRIDPDTWLVRSDAGLDSSYVVMGNVAYPVSDVVMGHTTHRFVARLNIGDVEFVPSREDVKYTRWTEETLADLADFIRTHYRRVLNTALATAASTWEEVQIKMLWKGTRGGTTLRSPDHDHKIWSYNPDVRWGRKSQAHNTYGLHNLISPNIVVITGFTAKTLSTVAKDRLTEMFGSKFYLIVPAGTKGVHLLDGRPNVHAWESVVGATQRPKAPKGSRGPKVETRYNTNVGPLTATELAALSGKVLYVNSGEHASRGSLGADAVVSLYSSAQLPRLQRLVPGISYYWDEVENQRKAALRAITPYDKRIAQARTLPSVFQTMDPNKVDDPDLAEHIRLSAMADTDTMTRAKNLGVGISFPEITDYIEKYPLLSSSSYYGTRLPANRLADERLFYLNARYAAYVEAQAAEEVAS